LLAGGEKVTVGRKVLVDGQPRDAREHQQREHTRCQPEADSSWQKTQDRPGLMLRAGGQRRHLTLSRALARGQRPPPGRGEDHRPVGVLDDRVRHAPQQRLAEDRVGDRRAPIDSPRLGVETELDRQPGTRLRLVLGVQPAGLVALLQVLDAPASPSAAASNGLQTVRTVARCPRNSAAPRAIASLASVEPS
jgi:hypothetical protein